MNVYIFLCLSLVPLKNINLKIQQLKDFFETWAYIIKKDTEIDQKIGQARIWVCDSNYDCAP